MLAKKTMEWFIYRDCVLETLVLDLSSLISIVKPQCDRYSCLKPTCMLSWLL